MTQARGAAERERDLDRLLTFVDAIVAIAITLLVLPLAELAGDLGDGEQVGQLVRDHSSDFWSFAISFYVISTIWQSQHASVSPLLRGSPRLTHLLMLWTFTIVVLPFPTSLVAKAGEQTVTKVAYLGTMIVSTLLVALIRAEIERHPELTDGTAPPSALGMAVTPLVMLLCLALMVMFPGTSYWPMLLLAVDRRVGYVVSRLRNRRGS